MTYRLAVTGHRPDKLGGYNTPNLVYNEVCDLIRGYLKSNPPSYVITGMALGVDQWTAQICIELGIPFLAAIPHEGHGANWPESSRNTYEQLLSKAKWKYLISKGPFTGRKMYLRNLWMVQNADKLLAMWDGSSGGTKNCIEAAVQVNTKVEYLKLSQKTASYAQSIYEQKKKLSELKILKKVTPPGYPAGIPHDGQFVLPTPVEFPEEPPKKPTAYVETLLKIQQKQAQFQTKDIISGSVPQIPSPLLKVDFEKGDFAIVFEKAMALAKEEGLNLSHFDSIPTKYIEKARAIHYGKEKDQAESRKSEENSHSIQGFKRKIDLSD